MFNKNDPLIGAVQEVMKKNQAEREAVRAVNEKFGIQDRKVLPHERQGEWDAAFKKVITEGVDTLKEDELNDMGKGRKKKAETYKHKTSGKEISAVSHPGKEWDLIKEASKLLNGEKEEPKQLEYHSTSELKDKEDKGRFTNKLKMVPKKKLDETSKERAGAYIKQAADDKATSADSIANAKHRKGSVAREIEHDETKRYQRRTKGIAMAVRRLTKEEEQIDEVLDTPGKRLKYYAKAAVSGVKASIKGDDKTVIKRTKGAEMAGRKTQAHIEKRSMDDYREKVAGKILKNMDKKANGVHTGIVEESNDE